MTCLENLTEKFCCFYFPCINVYIYVCMKMCILIESILYRKSKWNYLYTFIVEKPCGSCMYFVGYIRIYTDEHLYRIIIDVNQIHLFTGY